MTNNKSDIDKTPVPIMESEARQWIEFHPRIPLDMKHISEYAEY